MRALTLALVVTLALTAAACGDPDTDTSSSGSSGSGDYGDYGGSGGSGGSDTGTETDTGPVADEGCSERAPISVEPAEQWQGFIRLCEDDESRQLLVVENISNVVLRVSADTDYVDITAYAPEGDDLATAFVRGLNWDCGTNWCPVAPGGHLDAEGDPAEAFVQIDDAMTASVVFEKGLAGAITSRMEAARGGEGIRKAAACAEGVGSTVNAQNWQEQFRYGLTAAPACNSLRKMLFPPEDAEAAERSAAKLISKARSLSQGTWVDALLLAGTRIH